MAPRSLQFLLTREEFEKLSVAEMVVYRRELANRIRRAIADPHRIAAGNKNDSPPSG